MRFLARRYDTQQVVQVELTGALIASLHRAVVEPAEEHLLPWIAPGMVDLQVNGWGGQEFSSAQLTVERVAAIVQQHFAFGVTQFCPTLTTQSIDVLAHGLRTIHAACEQPAVARAVPGIHLEGPYFSTDDGPRGAHPLEHCRAPDWDEFQKLQAAAGGRIRILTMSPEFANSADFIAQVVASGVVVAVGHTGASGDQIQAAVDAGAGLSTHLGNGAHRMLRRHPNYLWDQLAEDRLVASLIVDGQHLPPEVVKVMLRAKTPERAILVSDVSGLAGLPEGTYTSSGCELDILADGRLVISGQDQLLAGASRPIGCGVANVMQFAGISLSTAIRMASTQPAALIGVQGVGLRPGDRADLVLFDHWADPQTGLAIRATISGGQVVYGAV